MPQPVQLDSIYLFPINDLIFSQSTRPGQCYMPGSHGGDTFPSPVDLRMSGERR